MKRNEQTVRLFIQLCVTFMLTLTLTQAIASPSNWVQIWNPGNNSGISVNIISCKIDNVNGYYLSEYGDVDGSWSNFILEFSDSTRQSSSVPIICPADGKVVYSDDDQVDVITDDGDYFVFAWLDEVYYWYEGDHILMGEEIGSVNFTDSNPKLYFEFIDAHHSSTLFGVSKSRFKAGVNLNDLDLSTYWPKPPTAPGSSSSSSSIQSPAQWVQPWSVDNKKLSAILNDCVLDGPSDTYSSPYGNVSGCWSIFTMTFEDLASINTLIILSPTDGTVLEIESYSITVLTDDGNLYVFDWLGAVYKQDVGSHIERGQAVGLMDLKYAGHDLVMQILDGSGTDTWFGVKKTQIRNGVDMTNLNLNTI